MKGIYWALSAAICNATIGIASEFALKNGVLFSSIAFYKCFGAFLMLLLWKLVRRQEWQITKTDVIHAAILGFLGVYCLYFFETWAFSFAPISIVSFTIYASGIVCLLLSWYYLDEALGWRKILSMLMILMGILMLKQIESHYSIGLYLALFAGLGYSLYLFLLKFWNKKATLELLLLIFLFGSIYLSFPWWLSGHPWPVAEQLPSLMWLVFVPTLLGFYCTNKAIEQSPAGLVQIVETSDPVFASVLAYLLLGQQLSGAGWLGCTVVLLGLFLLARLDGQQQGSSV